MENIEKENKDLEKKLDKIEKEVKKERQKLEDFVNAIYQNIQTAIQSIEELLKICSDESFCAELKRELKEYVKVKTELLKICEKLNVTPDDNSFLEKARLWTSIKMTTLMDKSVRHLAEMMLLGTVMGTTTCYKDLFDHKGVNDELYQILKKLEEIEESNFDVIKKFLKEM